MQEDFQHLSGIFCEKNTFNTAVLTCFSFHPYKILVRFRLAGTVRHPRFSRKKRPEAMRQNRASPV